MKIFEKNKKRTNKSWALQLQNYENCVRLSAVDDITGVTIAKLFIFNQNGTIYCSRFAKQTLEEKGYDPYEHKNEWNEDGSIIIKKF